MRDKKRGREGREREEKDRGEKEKEIRRKREGRGETMEAARRTGGKQEGKG